MGLTRDCTKFRVGSLFTENLCIFNIGYAETIGGVIEKESGISRRDWHQVFSGVPRREIILMAGTALAYSYHKALSTKVDEV